MKETTIELKTEVDVEVVVCCAECGEPLEFRLADSSPMFRSTNRVEVEVEPHQCEKEGS